MQALKLCWGSDEAQFSSNHLSLPQLFPLHVKPFLKGNFQQL
jgi:hypothetical protein